MKYILIDTNSRMVEAWESFFAEEASVAIRQGDLTNVIADAIVSPANSFGFMDGGLDYAISMRLGWELQAGLQSAIKALPEGELLVGKAMVLETGDLEIPYLISAPTMRVPMDFNVATSLNAYLAMKAALIVAKEHPAIESVGIPGFCTGVGKMQPMIAARQMYQAFLEIEKGQRMDFSNYTDAQKYQYHINPQGRIFG